MMIVTLVFVYCVMLPVGGLLLRASLCIRAQINEFEQHPGDYHRWPQRLR